MTNTQSKLNPPYADTPSEKVVIRQLKMNTIFTNQPPPLKPTKNSPILEPLKKTKA